MSKRKKLKDIARDDPSLKALPGGQQRISALTFRPSATGPAPPPRLSQELNARQRESALAPQTAEWVVKHHPHNVEQLAVAKKKVQEVREWLESFLQHAMQPSPRAAQSRVLLLTGPPGCGKTTTVRLLAVELGFELCEWQPSANVSWSEVQLSQQGPMRLRYMSKLAEFREFASRAKMPALSMAPSGHRQPSTRQRMSQSSQQLPVSRPKLMVVEDMPHASGAEGRAELAAALRELALAARMPIVVMATESTSAGRAEDAGGATGGWHGLHKDLIAALDACNARQLHFNPVTTAAMAKCLSEISAAECRELSTLEAKQLALESAGDLRHAIGTLQMLLCGAAVVPQAKAKKGAAAAAKRKRASLGQPEPQPRSMAFTGRDQGLTLFHALGKMLYNKRGEAPAPDPAQPDSSSQLGFSQLGLGSSSQPMTAGVSGVIDLTDDGDADAAPPSQLAPVAAGYRRLPLDCKPEAVLVQAGLEAPSVAAFLHENMPDFISDDGMDSAAAVYSYLSESDCLAAFRHSSLATGAAESDEYAVTSTADTAAALVAARGVLFGNTDQAPRRFLAMRAPIQYVVASGTDANRAALHEMTERLCLAGTFSGLSSAAAAVQVMPYVRTIAAAAPQSYSRMVQPSHWKRLWNGQLQDVAATGVLKAPPDAARDESRDDADGDFDDIETSE